VWAKTEVAQTSISARKEKSTFIHAHAPAWGFRVELPQMPNRVFTHIRDGVAPGVAADIARQNANANTSSFRSITPVFPRHKIIIHKKQKYFYLK
jgi:hypothetical protein